MKQNYDFPLSSKLRFPHRFNFSSKTIKVFFNWLTRFNFFRLKELPNTRSLVMKNYSFALSPKLQSYHRFSYSAIAPQRGRGN
ncbi:hypothetical protein Hanom_Chr04g00376911 [Helianthus anomalus]